MRFKIITSRSLCDMWLTSPPLFNGLALVSELGLQGVRLRCGVVIRKSMHSLIRTLAHDSRSCVDSSSVVYVQS